MNRAYVKPQQKLQAIKREMQLAIVRPLMRNRRAVSTVISNMILIAAVIVVGFVALSYAQTQSNNYEDQYQQTVTSDINQLKEKVSFEYSYYNTTAKTVRVYLLNSGEIDVTVDKVYLSTSSQDIIFSMYYKNGQSNPSHTLAAGQEGYIVANAILTSGLQYQVKISTGRQSNFAFYFIA